MPHGNPREGGKDEFTSWLTAGRPCRPLTVKKRVRQVTEEGGLSPSALRVVDAVKRRAMQASRQVPARVFHDYPIDSDLCWATQELANRNAMIHEERLKQKAKTKLRPGCGGGGCLSHDEGGDHWVVRVPRHHVPDPEERILLVERRPANRTPRDLPSAVWVPAGSCRSGRRSHKLSGSKSSSPNRQPSESASRKPNVSELMSLTRPKQSWQTALKRVHVHGNLRLELRRMHMQQQ